MKSITRFSAAAVIAAGFFVGSTAFGITNITIAAGTATPTGSVEIQNLPINNSSDFVWRSDAHQWFGQTFTVTGGGFILDKISVAVVQDNDPGDRTTAGHTIAIDVWTAANANDLSGTTVFGGVQAGVTPTYTMGEVNWLTFDVPDIALGAGLYGFTVNYLYLRNAADSPALLGGHKIGGSNGLQYDSSGAYAGGTGNKQVGAGGSNAFAGENDLVFVIQSTVIPEPTSVALTLGGLGLFGLIRRKRS